MKNLTNNAFNKLLRLLDDGFAGNLLIPKAGAMALLDSMHEELSEEIDNNLLNLPIAEQNILLEDHFLKLEYFGDSMPRGNEDIENSLAAAGGLEILFAAIGRGASVESFADRIEPDLLKEVRVYQIRNYVFHVDIQGFINLTGDDLKTYQQLFAAQLLTEAWEILTSYYVSRGGIIRAVPRKQGWKVTVKTSIRDDLHSFMPEMYPMSVESHPTEEDVYEEFCRHLGSIRWRNYPYAGSWQAPLEYEQAFHNAPDRNAFIAGCSRPIIVIQSFLNKPDGDNPLLRQDDGHLLAENREKQRRERLQYARVNAKRMLKWLQARQKPAATQLLEAFEYVVLVPVCDQEKWVPTDTLTVADYLPEYELPLRFEMLLQRLQDDMPTAQAELNLLRSRLTKLLAYPATAPAQAAFEFGQGTFNQAALVGLLPQFTLVDRTEDITPLRMVRVADDFGAKLMAVTTYRLPWAQRALDLVEVVLAQPTRVGSKPKLSLSQIALRYVYMGEVIPRGEKANEIARQYGHTCGEALRKHYNYYNQRKNRTGITRDKVKKVVADIEAVIPYLDGEYGQEAHSDLEKLKPSN